VRKTRRFGGATPQEQADVESWVMWQMANLGPVMGHGNHFRNYAPKIEPDPAKLEYGVSRFTNEANRLYGVLDARLKDREFVAGPLSIADFATWPWVIAYKIVGQDMDEFPNVRRWIDTCKARPAFAAGQAVGEDLRTSAITDNSKDAQEARRILFGQTARRNR
jgi:GSH-dependent disulfide-bond oxidoreductase